MRTLGIAVVLAVTLAACSTAPADGQATPEADRVLEDLAASMRPQVQALMDTVPTEQVSVANDYTQRCKDEGGWPYRWNYSMHGWTKGRVDSRGYVTTIVDRLADDGWKVRSVVEGSDEINRFVAQKDGFVLTVGGTTKGGTGIDLSSPCVDEDGHVDRRLVR